MVDGHQGMRALDEVADLAIVDVELRPVPVAEVRARDGLDRPVILNPSHTAELFTDDLDLLRDLVRVLGVLVMAASAPKEVGAWGLGPLGRWREHVSGAAAEHLFAVGLGFDARYFAGQQERREDDLPFQARECVPAVNPLLDGYFVYDEICPSLSMKARVLSGIQPTGNPHIGNYLGALKNWVKIQYDYESIYCIVDLHAITVYQQPEELRRKIIELAGILIAIGIDPKHSAIVVQSSVPAHAELAWLLTCVTPVGWLQRMTQFKAKSEAQETISDGLLQYPVLMAADILLYQAAIVPVGDDQQQHLELTRDIAQRFNSLYGETFVMPETRLPSFGARIMGLDEPDKKMSKSASGANHSISLLDPPSVIRKKIMRATTDSQPAVNFDAPGAGVANLLSIYQAFTECSSEQLRADFEGKRYGDLKKQVAEAVVSHIEPIQKRYAEIMADPSYVPGVLSEGARRVTPVANDTVRKVKHAMGIYT